MSKVKSKAKPAKAKFVPIQVTLTFNQDDIQAILNDGYFGDGECPLKADKLTKKQYNELKKELVHCSGQFVDEIVEATQDSCANGWLDEFFAEHAPDPDDEEEGD